MDNFSSFINSIFNKSAFSDLLSEKLITFGKKAYPKFGNVVILAGGAGSGKGFITSNLIGLEGKVLDVDELKKIAMTAPKFMAKVKKETGHDLSKLDLRNPDNVSLLHRIIGITYDIPNKQQQTLITGIMSKPKDRKPNIIFDVTLKNITKLHNISNLLESAGYDKKNIHIVWVINSVDVAWEQNKKRSRVVPEDIFLDTHKGASLSMKEIIDMGNSLKKYMDGDIWFAFNKVGVDAKVAKSKNGGSYIEDANFIKIKSAGKPQLSSKEIPSKLIDKIKSYVPKIKTWDN